jgi:hypothetical protein
MISGRSRAGQGTRVPPELLEDVKDWEGCRVPADLAERVRAAEPLVDV